MWIEIVKSNVLHGEIKVNEISFPLMKLKLKKPRDFELEKIGINHTL